MLQLFCALPQKSNNKKPNVPPKEGADSAYCDKFINLPAQKHFWHLHQLLSAQRMLIPSADPSPNCAFVRHDMKWWDGGVTFFWDVPVCTAWPIISRADRSWTGPRGGGILIQQPMHCQAVINLHAEPNALVLNIYSICIQIRMWRNLMSKPRLG